jgi:coproporphyrinogen III oxidase
METKKNIAQDWFKTLRDQIREEFIKIEKEFNSNFSSTFDIETWNRSSGGGGEISLLYGDVFEKVGVNISTVYGEFSEKFAAEIPGTQKSGNKFWASGISLVSHMKSPLVPTVHMNTRMIITDDYWFGGGTDLTPTYYNEDDKVYFHENLKSTCDKHNHEYYTKFSKWADDYFFIKHRNEPRGIGGIFYDYLNTNNWENDFSFTRDVGECFLKIYPEIVRRNMYQEYHDEQKEFQLLKRGRYVEFNLVYDRGTRFGLMTDGNPKAILMSLPPTVKWGDF